MFLKKKQRNLSEKMLLEKRIRNPGYPVSNSRLNQEPIPNLRSGPI